MPISVSDIAKEVGDLLLDDEHIRWPVAEIIRWGNEAMGAILNRHPQAFSRTVVMSLAAGTKQEIPEGGVSLLDVVRNMAADGVSPGSAIRRSDRQQLDDADPNWHLIKPKSAVRQFMHDDRLPTVFYVYPPVNAGVKAEIVHTFLPDQVAETDVSGEFDCRREYTEAVVNYVCYRCLSKDADFANGQVAAAYYQAFEAALGVKTQAQMAASPNQPTNSV